MKNIFIYFLVGILGMLCVYAQENVGIATSNPHSSAALDLTGDELPANGKKGLLLPRVSLQNNTDVTTIPSPAEGLVVFNQSNSGSGTSAVVANTFYYWDGVKWVELGDINKVKSILLPQVFFVTETAPQNTVTTTPNINTGDVVLTYNAANIALNTGNNIQLAGTENFRFLNSGMYEISGYINYNPSIDINQFTNLEYVIQMSSNGGGNWTDVAKTTLVWGMGTGANSRTNSIAPIVVELGPAHLIRCVVRKTEGSNHGANAAIRASTGMMYSKLLKIQKLD